MRCIFLTTVYVRLHFAYVYSITCRSFFTCFYNAKNVFCNVTFVILLFTYNWRYLFVLKYQLQIVLYKPTLDNDALIIVSGHVRQC